MSTFDYHMSIQSHSRSVRDLTAIGTYRVPYTRKKCIHTTTLPLKGMPVAVIRPYHAHISHPTIRMSSFALQFLSGLIGALVLVFQILTGFMISSNFKPGRIYARAPFLINVWVRSHFTPTLPHDPFQLPRTSSQFCINLPQP